MKALCKASWRCQNCIRPHSQRRRAATWSTPTPPSRLALLLKMVSSNAPALVLESGLMLKQVKTGDGGTFSKDGD